MRSKYLTKFTKILAEISLFGLNGALMVFLACYLYVEPQLPSVEKLREIKLQTPMTVYSSEGELMSFFGATRRIPVSYEELPPLLNHALIATEDKRFFEHSGVDPMGIARAVFNLVSKGQIDGGGSTITMQLARNFFLNFNQTFTRKTKEIFLSWKIERQFTKEEILTLYWNKIEFSNRAHGVGAAAEVYYGTTIDQLTLPQLAILAGIPKGPTTHNPIQNPEKALNRRNHVLRRMYLEGYIDEASYKTAVDTPLTASYHGQLATVSAPYLSEMVRREMIDRYGQERAYSEGFKVFTTINANLQLAGRNALREGLLEYDVRHGYRGPESHIPDLAELFLPLNQSELLGPTPSSGDESVITDIEQLSHPLLDELTPEMVNQSDVILRDLSQYADLIPAIVIAVEERRFHVLIKKYDRNTKLETRLVTVDWDGIEWARPFISESRVGAVPRVASDVVKVGDLVRVRRSVADPTQWSLSQTPQVASALVSLNPNNGAIQSLVGGFDYNHRKYNFAVDGTRQIGSNIKPFIYSAAFEKGYTAASVVNDAPLTQVDASSESVWRPENSSGTYKGPTRLREALKSSTNLVSIRLLKDITPSYAVEYMSNLGFDRNRLPAVDSLALGAAEFSPLEVATGYAIFANGGYRVEPYFIERIEDASGNVLFEAEPLIVCKECEEERQRLQVEEQLAELTIGSSFQVSTEDAPTKAEAQLLAELDAELAGETPIKPLATPETNEEPDDLLSLDAPLDLSQRFAVPEKQIAPRVIAEDNVFILNNMMQDVITRGTAQPTLSASNSPLLMRTDLAGKTGTTNEARDAWFSGFNPNYVTTSWVGYPNSTNGLGRNEYGGKAALPIWQKFMEYALDGQPVNDYVMPAGLVSARIDPASGLLAPAGMPGAMFEVFRQRYLPKQFAEQETTDPFGQEKKKSEESIF